MRIIPIKAFQDNYIWMLFAETASTEAAKDQAVCVVDPGDAEPVIEYLEKHQLRLTDILITHYHHDHIGGVQTLKDRYQCLVYAPQRDDLPFTDVALVEGDTIELFAATSSESLNFKVFEIPGHTLGHIAYYCAERQLLLCGDTLFRAGCGRMFEGTGPQFYRSLQKLAQLPEETRVYCTHEYTLANLAFASSMEPDNIKIKQLINECQGLRQQDRATLPSTIGSELATNPFLRCEEKQLVSQAAKVSGIKFEQLKGNPIETFVTIRRLKDNFKP